MNRLVTVNVEDVDSSLLPPPSPTGPARILFLTATFLGFGTYHRSLLEYGERRDDVDAVHVELRAPRWLKVLGKSVPLNVRGWDFHPYRHLLLWRRLIRRWLRGPLSLERFDVVHVITQGNALAVVDFAGDPTTGFAINIDGTAVQQITEFGLPAITQRPFIAAERRMFAAADLVVCRNRWCAESLRKDFDRPEEQIVIARNSMRPLAASRLDQPRREPTALPRIVFVGNAFRRKKGPELVALHQSRWADRAELHICSRHARPDRSVRHVVWHGAVPREELLERLLPTMDVFVLPTAHDMHPWAVLEAAAAGLPVVSVRLAGIPEIVREGHTGHLVRPGDWDAFADAVDTLIDDPERRLAFGLAAREHVVASYDPDEAYGGLFDRLVELAARVRRGTDGAGARGRAP